MTSPEQQLTATRTHTAIIPLTDRAFLRITGSDATRWLNGMVTNSVTALAPGQGAYNFLLNAQGRIQADCTIYREASEPASFLLATSAAQLPTIQSHLDRFIIMDDVELTPTLTDESTLLVLGPEAPAALVALSLPAPDPLRLTHADSSDGPVLILTPSDTSTATPRFELRASTAVITAIHRQILSTANVVEITPETLEYLRILEATPLFGKDIRDRDLPQETAQQHALHFNKGCYLGQEIVERIRSRGQVHRVFTAFRLTGDLPSTLPAPLESNGKPAGELTSISLIPLPEGPTLLALGYARREALQPGAPLQYSGGTAIPLPSGTAST
jgi:folate-binding protein YgfZ